MVRRRDEGLNWNEQKPDTNAFSFVSWFHNHQMQPTHPQIRQTNRKQKRNCKQTHDETSIFCHWKENPALVEILSSQRQQQKKKKKFKCLWMKHTKRNLYPKRIQKMRKPTESLKQPGCSRVGVGRNSETTQTLNSPFVERILQNLFLTSLPTRAAVFLLLRKPIESESPKPRCIV